MRYASIDLLRTLAIILMVVVHFLENLSGFGWAPAGFGAPMFGFLVGVSYRIWLQQQIARNRPDREISRVTFRRGVFIFVLGLAFNAIAWLPADLFNWDVLTLIGSAMILLGLMRDLPAVVPLTTAAVVFVLGPVFTAHSDYYSYWQQGYFDPDWTFSQISLGYLVNGYFPLFPWLMFPLIGSVVGNWILPARDKPDPAKAFAFRRVWPLIAGGLAFIAIELLLYATRGYQTGSLARQLLRGWTMFPASFEYVVTVLGTVLLSFGLALWLVDARRGLDRFPWLLSATRSLSQHSLSVYVLHHVLHLWPLWIYGLLKGQEATYYWRNAMPVAWSAWLSLPCMVVLYLLARFVMQGRKWSFETLMRRICDGQKATGPGQKETMSSRPPNVASSSQ